MGRRAEPAARARRQPHRDNRRLAPARRAKTAGGARSGKGTPRRRDCARGGQRKTAAGDGDRQPATASQTRTRLLRRNRLELKAHGLVGAQSCAPRDGEDRAVVLAPARLKSAGRAARAERGSAPTAPCPGSTSASAGATVPGRPAKGRRRRRSTMTRALAAGGRAADRGLEPSVADRLRRDRLSRCPELVVPVRNSSFHAPGRRLPRHHLATPRHCCPHSAKATSVPPSRATSKRQRGFVEKLRRRCARPPVQSASLADPHSPPRSPFHPSRRGG